MAFFARLAEKAQDRLATDPHRRTAQVATAAFLWASVVFAICLLGVVAGLLSASAGSPGIAVWALLITLLTLIVATLHTVVADISRRRVMLFTHGGTFVRLQKSSILLSRAQPILYLTVVIALGVNQSHYVPMASVHFGLAQAAIGLAVLLMLTTAISASLTVLAAPFATSLFHISAPTADVLSPPGSRGRTSGDASVDNEKGPSFILESERARTTSPIKQPAPRRSLSSWSTSTGSTQKTTQKVTQKMTGKRKPRHPRPQPTNQQNNTSTTSLPPSPPSTATSSRTTGLRPSTAESSTSRSSSCFKSLPNPPAEDAPLPPVPVHYTRPKSNPLLVPVVPPRAASRLAGRPCAGAPPGIGHGRPSPTPSLASGRPGPRHPAGAMRPIRAGSSSTLASRSSRASETSSGSSILRGHGASGDWAALARAPVTPYNGSAAPSNLSITTSASSSDASVKQPTPPPRAEKGHRMSGSTSTGGSSMRRVRASVLSVISSVDEEVEKRAERDAAAQAQRGSGSSASSLSLRPAPLNVNKHKIAKRWSRGAEKRGSLLLLPPIQRFESLGDFGGGGIEGVRFVARG